MPKKVRDKNRVLKNDIHNDIGRVLEKKIEKFSQPQNQEGSQRNLYTNQYDKNGKIFTTRNSVLTNMFVDDNIKAVYNLFLSTFILAIARTLVTHIIGDEQRPIYSHIENWVKKESLSVTVYWTEMLMLTFLIYPLCNLFYRFFGKINIFAYLIHILYMIFFNWFAFNKATYVGFSHLSSLIICIEQIRFTKKMYSFFRENVRFYSNERPFPAFSKYCYFLFCPVLIYRDDYPRTPKIRWNVFFIGLLQSAISAIFVGVVIEIFGIPSYERIFKNDRRLTNILIAIIENSTIGTLLLLSLFFFMLHSWLNMFAEVLRFGDRMFYTEWWNSISYTEFYKTWNIVVHDWLKAYIFNDLRTILPTKIRTVVASIVTIFGSALIHEYVAFVSVGSFCPAFLVMFGIIGLILKFYGPTRGSSRTTHHIWNALVWSSFSLGGGVFLTIYGGELYASNRCKINITKTFINCLKPALFDMNCNPSIG